MSVVNTGRSALVHRMMELCESQNKSNRFAHTHTHSHIYAVTRVWHKHWNYSCAYVCTAPHRAHTRTHTHTIGKWILSLIRFVFMFFSSNLFLWHCYHPDYTAIIVVVTMTNKWNHKWNFRSMRCKFLFLSMTKFNYHRSLIL